MESIITEYIESAWGITTNLVIILFFGLIAYNIYAKRWSAKSGSHYVRGRITWSELIRGTRYAQALISYSYYVDGIPYNGELYVSPFRMEKTIKENPKGKEITVYYSIKDPGFSRAYKPPSHVQIIGASVINFLLLPGILINIIAMYFYWLIDVSN